MESVTLGQIAATIGTISVIAAFFVAIYKWFKKSITDRFEKLEGEIRELKQEQKSQKIDIENSKREQELQLTGLLACLKALHDMGANGPTTKAIQEIEQFMIKKSHD